MPQPSIEDICEQSDPESDVEHLVVCPACGQIFDCRDPANLAHHDQPEHTPLLVRPARNV
jgi:hypothetical protein